MQSSGLEVEQAKVAPLPGLIERLSWTDKAPLALGFGCLFGLCSPGFDLWWLAWVGLTPLLVLIQGARGKLEAAIVGLSFGMGYHLVALAWYLGLYPLRWMGMEDWLAFQSTVIVWVAEAFHQSILIVGLSVILSAVPMRAGLLPFFKRPYFPYLVSVPVAWVFLQWVVGTSELFLGVPVNQLAYSQCKQLELIQMVKLGGSQLLDFILVAVNAGVAAVIIEGSGWVPRLVDRADRFSTRVGARVDLLLAVGAVAGFYFWGQAELSRLASLTSLTRKADELLRTRVSRNLNEEMEVHSTILQRVADGLAWFSGSMPFLISHTVWFIAWISLNTIILRQRAFDPFPFGLLTMIVSLEAIFLACFVLISQNRQAQKDKVRADIEYEVNIKAELEIAHLHEKTDRLYEKMMARFERQEKGPAS